MCLFHTRNLFLREPGKSFPQSWVGESYLSLSFLMMYFVSIKATSPSTVSNWPNSYSVTFWGSYEGVQSYRKWLKIEVLQMIFHNIYNLISIWTRKLGRWPGMFFVIVLTKPNHNFKDFAPSFRNQKHIFWCHTVRNGTDLRRSPRYIGEWSGGYQRHWICKIN